MLAGIITISPNVKSRTLVFAETRVPAKNLIDYLKAGDNIEEFLAHFPSVKRSQIVGLPSYVEYLFVFNSLTR